MAPLVQTVPVDPEPDAGHTLRQYAASVWKRRVWIFALVILGIGGGWLKGRWSPDVYAVRTEIDITKQRPFGISPSGGNQVVSFGEGYLESQLHYPTRYKLLASGRYITSLLQAKTEADGRQTFPMWDWLTWPAYFAERPSQAETLSATEREARFGPAVEGAEAFEQLVSVPAAEFRTRFAFRAYGPPGTRSPTSPYATPEDLRPALEGHVSVEPVKGTALVDIELDGERKDVLAPLLNLLIETFAREQRTEGQRRLALERKLLDRQRDLLVGAPSDPRAVGPAAVAPPDPGFLGAAREKLAGWVREKGRSANELELRRKVLATQVEEGEKEIRAVSDRLAAQRGEVAALVGDLKLDDTPVEGGDATGRDDAAARRLRAQVEGDEAAARAIREQIAAIAKIDATTKDSRFHHLPFVLVDPRVAELAARLAKLRAGETTATATQTELNLAVAQVAFKTAIGLARDFDVRATKRTQYARDLLELGASWQLSNELSGLQAEVDRRAKDLAAIEERRETIRTQESVEAGLQPLRVIEPANDPSRPVRPNRLLLLLVGAGVGLLLGLALALLLEWLDDSVSDPVDVERFLHAPVLGTIVALGARDDGAAEVDRIASKLPDRPWPRRSAPCARRSSSWAPTPTAAASSSSRRARRARARPPSRATWPRCWRRTASARSSSTRTCAARACTPCSGSTTPSACRT